MRGNNKNKQQGFTLIELLVVVSIISLLASVVLVALNNARVKARDARRAGDIRQISTALELFVEDKGHYPITECSVGGLRWTSFDSPLYSPNQLCDTQNGAYNGKTLSQELSPYLNKAGDPKNLGSDSGYLYISNTGSQYCILFWRTPENLRNYSPSSLNQWRCSGIDSNGQCIGNASNPSNFNSIYIGTGAWASGC